MEIINSILSKSRDDLFRDDRLRIKRALLRNYEYIERKDSEDRAKRLNLLLGTSGSGVPAAGPTQNIAGSASQGYYGPSNPFAVVNCRPTKDGGNRGANHKSSMNNMGIGARLASTQAASVYVSGLEPVLTLVQKGSGATGKALALNWARLDTLFGAYGRVKRIKFYRDKQGNLKGDGLVTYVKAGSAHAAVKALDGHRLDLLDKSTQTFNPKPHSNAKAKGAKGGDEDEDGEGVVTLRVSLADFTHKEQGGQAQAKRNAEGEEHEQGQGGQQQQQQQLTQGKSPQHQPHQPQQQHVGGPSPQATRQSPPSTRRLVSVSVSVCPSLPLVCRSLAYPALVIKNVYPPNHHTEFRSKALQQQQQQQQSLQLLQQQQQSSVGLGLGLIQDSLVAEIEADFFLEASRFGQVLSLYTFKSNHSPNHSPSHSLNSSLDKGKHDKQDGTHDSATEVDTGAEAEARRAVEAYLVFKRHHQQVQQDERESEAEAGAPLEALVSATLSSWSALAAEGAIAVTFATTEAATACGDVMHGRYFDERRLEVQPWGLWGQGQGLQNPKMEVSVGVGDTVSTASTAGTAGTAADVYASAKADGGSSNSMNEKGDEEEEEDGDGDGDGDGGCWWLNYSHDQGVGVGVSVGAGLGATANWNQLDENHSQPQQRPLPIGFVSPGQAGQKKHAGQSVPPAAATRAAKGAIGAASSNGQGVNSSEAKPNGEGDREEGEGEASAKAMSELNSLESFLSNLEHS